MTDESDKPVTTAALADRTHTHTPPGGARKDGYRTTPKGEGRDDGEIDRDRGYLPIENYGMIGNMRTVAMCGTDGAIDFFCYPKFDSPSIFARILDQHKGGHFHIFPVGETRHKQQYLPNSNVLQTRFLSEEGVIHVTDFMPVPSAKKPFLHWLNRVVECKRGKYKVRIECYPAFDYARAKHTTTIVQERGLDGVVRKSSTGCSAGGATVVFKSSCGLTMDLRHVIYCGENSVGIDVSDPAVHCDDSSNDKYEAPELTWSVEQKDKMLGPGVWAEVELKEGQRISFAFRERPEEEDAAVNPTFDNDLMESLLKDTFSYWIRWIGKSKYSGRWREAVHRSALSLKLLIYEPTGAVVAAPTFGLPEELGGERNWDYRYTWVRDSAFTIYALIRIGLTEEAEGFMNFIENRCQELTPEGALQVMYTIDGKHELPETSLEHLEGYRGSRPVRIGNGAYDHLQLDIYGELLDSIYLYNKYRAPVSYDTWCQVRKLVNYVCGNWDKPDMSIWEVRGLKKNFTYSKVMCWVAVDRGLRLAEKRSLPCPDRAKWLETRDKIYETVMTDGWSAKRQCFIQCYEEKENPVLDASILIMPLCFFISASDPRMISTIKQIMLPPEKGGLLANNLVYRYDRKAFDDGLSGEGEGTFSMCTFWLVEALCRAGKQHPDLLERAVVMFEQMIAYGNHLTLFSEEIAGSGEMLGNFPQAFTHIAMMSAAFNLDRSLSGKAEAL
ncbi:glycoside hydrolase family 15 protein [Fimicolochytrium jonesii]|uniref:glycoside hydrolase family 15 protein n=1 Tax=Fimicolochytrium jonesii TaxID=1396493 RepID=UPI0022FF3091|nr:glycoside hydrolase family 15 protein [Fimicolochytrium jonesii]KAI8823994.1 glycoside hydrolase family 15 protein [Fimicolochytrium jonesii]